MVDEDGEAALAFINEVIYPKVKDAEKPGACFHDVEKPIDGVRRPIDRHKKLGTFD